MLAPCSNAQFTVDNQTNTIDSLLNYSGTDYIGKTYYGNFLPIKINGTIVNVGFDPKHTLGTGVGAGNNAAYRGVCDLGIEGYFGGFRVALYPGQ